MLVSKAHHGCHTIMICIFLLHLAYLSFQLIEINSPTESVSNEVEVV